MEKQFYNRREVAIMLSTSVSKINRMIADGDLEAIDLNPSGKRRTYRISQEAISKLTK